MTDVKKVLVKEKLAPEGVKYLEDHGFQVDIGTEWDADELLRRIPEYHGLIIRSATKVTADVIQAGTNLQVVGRAGVGVDNVDVKEATKRGVIVVNAPQSNVLSAAEQTIALLMACARNLAQAHADLKAGEWNKGKWGKGGVEVRGKTLGIIGLGRIGFLVAEDARGLGMNVLAYDPFVPAEKFHELGLERADSPDKIYREADFITVHLPKNAETLGFIGDDEFAKMKDGVRVINVARGGIIDEDAWARAIESGKVAASAVDVYPKEPTTESPLFKYDSVVATPHLGRQHGRGAAPRRHDHRRAGGGRPQGRVRQQRGQHPAGARRGCRRAHAVPRPLRDAREAHRADRRRPGGHLRDRLRRRHRPLRHAHPHARRAAGRACRQGRRPGQLRQRAEHRRGARHLRQGDEAAGRGGLPQPDHRDHA